MTRGVRALSAGGASVWALAVVAGLLVGCPPVDPNSDNNTPDTNDPNITSPDGNLPAEPVFDASRKLRLYASSSGPPDYELRWNFNSGPASKFVVYAGTHDLSTPTEADVLVEVDGTLRGAPVRLETNSGCHYLRVKVLVPQDEGAYSERWSPQYVVDTTVRVGFSINNLMGRGRAVCVLTPDANEPAIRLSGELVATENAYGPVWSPDGRLAAFYGDFETPNAWEMYIVAADGSGRQKVSPTPPDAQQWIVSVAWSPDGAFLGYEVLTGAGDGFDRHRHIYLAPAAGGASTLVASDAYTSAAWSPDGGALAFVADANGDGAPALCRYSVDAGWTVELARASGVEQWGPWWSADGQTLAFYSDDESPQTVALYVVSATGGTRRAVIDPLPSGADGVVPNFDFTPWSPTGDRLLVNVDAPVAREHAFYVVQRDGLARTAVASELAICGAGNIPVWAADGTHVGLTVGTYPQCHEAVYVANVATGVLTSHAGSGPALSGPHFAPDLERYAFTTDAGLFIAVNDVQAAPLQITGAEVTAGGLRGPVSWSPDASLIAYVAEIPMPPPTPQPLRVFVAAADGSTPPVDVSAAALAAGEQVGEAAVSWARLANP
jgi:hypothetical protein